MQRSISLIRKRPCCELSNVGLYARPSKEADLHLQYF